MIRGKQCWCWKVVGIAWCREASRWSRLLSACLARASANGLMAEMEKFKGNSGVLAEDRQRARGTRRKWLIRMEQVEALRHGMSRL